MEELLDEPRYKEFPAKIFDTIAESNEFVAELRSLDISYMTQINSPPKRLKQPVTYIVMILDPGHGTRH